MALQTMPYYARNKDVGNGIPAHCCNEVDASVINLYNGLRFVNGPPLAVGKGQGAFLVWMSSIFLFDGTHSNQGVIPN